MSDHLLGKVTAWLTAHPVVRKPLNTFWQTFVSFFLLGILPVLSELLKTHDLAAAQVALGALVISAGAAALSAVKTAIVESLRGQ